MNSTFHHTSPGPTPTYFHAAVRIVDEARGLVYMNQPFGKVRTMDIASGQIIHESDEGFGFGVVAPNLSGSLSISNSKDALVWLSFPELTYTLLKPSKLTGYPSYEEPGPDVMYSADGSMMMFRSDFGGTGGPIGGTIDRRVMIETLSEL